MEQVPGSCYLSSRMTTKESVTEIGADGLIVVVDVTSELYIQDAGILLGRLSHLQNDVLSLSPGSSPDSIQRIIEHRLSMTPNKPVCWLTDYVPTWAQESAWLKSVPMSLVVGFLHTLSLS